MKKAIILSACAFVGFAAMAQETVIKDAEKAMKKGAEVTEVVTIITPAFSDPSTKSQAATYYIPGKAGFNQYDNLLGLEALNKLDEAGKAKKSNALYEGFTYMMKALPLDPVTDEKGKIKTKYTKDIVSTIAGHYNDINFVGGDMWNAKEYGKAYELWNAYATLPENPEFAKALKSVLPPDTILAETAYNSALAAWQAENLQASLDAFMTAKKLGYKKVNLYEYALAVAQQLKDNDKVIEIAKEAFDLYGAENPNFIGTIINDQIEKKQYNEAITLIDQAIAGDPTKAQYYVIKGIIIEANEDIQGNPTEWYLKAVQAEPNNDQALYNYGRMIYNNALQIYNNASEADFPRIFAEEFKPEMLKAVDYFEKAWDANHDNMDNLKLLEQAYYMLQDESNLQYTKDRQK